MEEAELEKLGREYQSVQEQVQSLAIQKEQFTLQNEEYTDALGEIEKSEGKVYVSIGGAIVEVSKEKALEELKERKELLEARLGSITKQYDEASKKGKALRDKLSTALGTPAKQ